MAPLQRDILRVLAWFSLFDYAVTAEQVHGQLRFQSSLREVREALQNLSPTKEEHGLYRLKEGSYGWEERLHRTRFSLSKFRRAQRSARYLSVFPWVRGVAICNTLAWMHTRKESDVDLFVIVREGTIWSTRFLAVLPYVLFRARPEETREDPLCFSFFLSDHALDLSSIALPDGDPYLASWIRSVLPLYDRDGVFGAFRSCNERGKATPGTRSRFPRVFERVACFLQQRRFPQDIRQLMNTTSAVVVNDRMLKFHTNDRRVLFRDLWNAQWARLGV